MHTAMLAQRTPGHAEPWPLLSSVDLGKLPEGVTFARKYVTYMLIEWSHLRRLTETAQIIVSELVTNSICHAEPPTTLILMANSTNLLIECWDAGMRSPVRHTVPADNEYGHGLTIVNAFSTDWGWFEEPGGKCVWAML